MVPVSCEPELEVRSQNRMRTETLKSVKISRNNYYITSLQ